ncbi:FecCD family ABC transporter permease [Actinotignum urinale]|uniref:Iron ABC transporter permease n=1 Tax=Actinotignum urinale TaxID=190146 RepID=A0AAW9HKL0_9ACTO|nr:iron ABC transporter permease [Actinotignum urinale]MDY5128754.1 iron ABC transporter permease [Actinotignum urinale]MDY5154327.1 iron ABC transporter permease [Actinotignum urinale]
MSQEKTASALIAQHRKIVLRRWAIISVLVFLALFAFMVSVAVGALNIGFGDVLRAIFAPGTIDDKISTVVWSLRLPMAVMALLIGCSLSLAGGQMQTILGNPLAEPFTLGISAAAAFGGGASIVLGIMFVPSPQLNIAMIAWVSSMIATLIIVVFSVFRGASAESMVLLGIALVFLFQALLALIQYTASTEALSQIVFWAMGSMTRASWMSNAIMAGVLALTIPIFCVLSWRLTALRLGDARAAAMGVNVARLRILVLIVVSIIAATSVAFAGIIGFVGLVGPHIARMLVGEDQRYFMPASMAAGALMMCGSHAISLAIKPGLAIPIGIITAIVGVPFFLGIILTRRRAMWT